MQASDTLQRQSQYLSQSPAESYKPSSQNMDTSQASGSQPRSSSGSARPHGTRTTNPDKQISQIEKSVTHLLVATKQLLETLTQWSRGNAQEEEVSDVYVRLGYEFNLACRAFNSIGVETSDLGPVPDLLRSILEDTLSQSASPQALDNYLPRIRDIIINLLHGLKKKQSKLRSRASKDGSSKSQTVPPRQSSVGSVNSTETGLTNMMEGVPSTTSSLRSESRQSEDDWTPANTSVSTRGEAGSIHRQSARPQSRQVPQSEAAQTPMNSTGQGVPMISMPAEQDYTRPSAEVPFPHPPPPPPPPPKQDALTALQRGGDLERRASRRFSAYQISKHLGASSTGVPVIPPAQNSPVPNRGREVRESMSAVRSRTTNQVQKQRSANRLAEIPPSSTSSFKSPQRISEEREEPVQSKDANVGLDTPAELIEPPDSPTVKTPEEFEAPRTFSSINNGVPVVGATLSGPLSPAPVEFLGSNQDRDSTQLLVQGDVTVKDSRDAATEPSIYAPRETRNTSTLSPSPVPTKDLTLFLQYKSKIKKFVLSDGYDDLTIARLQLAFIEKFNWNTHNNGIDLPEIYIQDPVSGIRHELEDLNDVKDRSVLVLNVEVLDEVKKHFDEGIGGLKTTLEGVRSLLDGQGSLMQRFSDRQLEASKEMARLSAAPTQRTSRTVSAVFLPAEATSPTDTSMGELQNLRRDIAVLRQTYSTMASDFAAAMKDIKAKAEDVKATAADVVAPTYEGNEGRAHVDQGKKTLNTDSELLVNRVDDLSDAVEDLRKDVVTRGVRPLPRQLEDISREIAGTARDLVKVKEFLKREKPIWTKIWEKELNLVCTERDDLTQQEDLMADLDGDLEDVTNVFKLVEEAMKQQNLNGGAQSGLKGSSKQLDFDTAGIDPQAAKDGVLGEVRALRPNHETRLEAIERAEKLRQKELENRKGGEFQREVATFVEEGKLKKTGGTEEVERLRKIKDDRANKENYERQQARAAEMERKRAEAAAARAAAAAEAATAAKANGETDQRASTSTSITESAAQASPESSHEVQQSNEVVPQDDMTSAGSMTAEHKETVPGQFPDTAPATTALPDMPAHKGEEVSNTSTARPSQVPDGSKATDAEDHKADSETSAPSDNDRQSWWKPALFVSS